MDSQRKQKKKAPIEIFPRPAMTTIMDRIPPMATEANNRSERTNPITQLPVMRPAINSPMPTKESHSAASRADIVVCSVT